MRNRIFHGNDLLCDGRCTKKQQHRGLKFGTDLTSLTSKPKAHNVTTSLKTESSQCHNEFQNRKLTMPQRVSKQKTHNATTSLKTESSQCHCGLSVVELSVLRLEK